MVLVSYNDGLNVAIWLDAFLPKHERLVKFYKERFPTHDYSENDPDDLVGNLLADLHDKQEKRYRFTYSYVHLLHNYGIAPGVSPLVNELDKKSSVSSGEEYRQIIFVSKAENDGRLKNCVKEVQKYLGLKNRKDYANEEFFKKSVNGLLDLVLEPFSSPQVAAARQLREFGFDKLSAL